MTLFPFAAFDDNYIWVLHHQRRALVVDPGEGHKLAPWLNAEGLRLEGILITHHHQDHTGAVDQLRQATGAQVFGPLNETLPQPLTRVSQSVAAPAVQRVQLLGLEFEVIDVPGHTAGHVAYFCPEVDGKPLLFCGDTLFSGGCGRLFEGTAAQMHDSLSRLASLPDDTLVCCAHEYTLSNLCFALAVEPQNPLLSDYAKRCQDLRARQLPTLPSSIGLEKQINPFLRAHLPAVDLRARQHDPSTGAGALGVFTTLRAWKNLFQ